jgi:hypothetical protein
MLSRRVSHDRKSSCSHDNPSYSYPAQYLVFVKQIRSLANPYSLNRPQVILSIKGQVLQCNYVLRTLCIVGVAHTILDKSFKWTMES